MKKNWHLDNPLQCPMVIALNMVGGKWKPIILHMLAQGTMRFNEIKRNIPPVSQKMLTQQLRELEADEMVNRKVYPEVPPKVEYSLTEKGQSLMPILQKLYEWGEAQAENQ
ncbi:transcriptional regulator [Hahella sp. CCB-MM4]|uniref:winged helix-turn-helix transcriptional regulator n=1 Tax=Hahella sp. (strain CCB-MM4) TaxID=1926491 RepID=UPI000B9A9772|nr:helix-turn-helix domain-containing protein [Hahella sp. CCB-MM4]OZG72836.1 transcriptional regulator [Hahella sp. CCB-MM4]